MIKSLSRSATLREGRWPESKSSLPCCQFVLIFFFQAEDGIRDYKVTGVQTCALPILRSAAPPPPRAATAAGAIVLGRTWHHGQSVVLEMQRRRSAERRPFDRPAIRSHRSEERRVGKECRSRGSPYH